MLTLYKRFIMATDLEKLIDRYRALGIDQQLDYDKFYLYSIITHSTAIEGSTITELENQIMFDNGIALKGKSLIEQNMNLDLKAAYEKALIFARDHAEVTVQRLKEWSALTMKNTGSEYHTVLGDFSSSNGDLRLLNVTTGVGGRSYMSFTKVPAKLNEFCLALNQQRKNTKSLTMQELYDMSFDAHYNLVTIHPWADGNGRMARLVMNWLQFENGLIPSRIMASDKEDYIKALVETRENDDLSIFRKFMTKTMIHHLSKEISVFEESIEKDLHLITLEKKKTDDKIIELLKVNPRHTSKTLAVALGLTQKGIEKLLAKLKSQGKIERIESAKGGSWKITENPNQNP